MKKSIQIWTRTVGGSEVRWFDIEDQNQFDTVQQALAWCEKENKELENFSFQFRYFVREVIDYETAEHSTIK